MQCILWPALILRLRGVNEFSEIPLESLNGPITPKRTLSPLDVQVYMHEFGDDWLRFAAVIPDRLILQTPKVNTLCSFL